jgi:hypothetical protein
MTFEPDPNMDALMARRPAEPTEADELAPWVPPGLPPWLSDRC